MTSELADDEKIKTALVDLNRLIEERVKREQRRDQLTGLPNGLALDELLEMHLERGREIWAAFVEIDKFKTINDRFGYLKADELLKMVAGLLADISSSLPGAAQVFRPHGDEFYIVGAHDGPDTHRPDALATLLELVCAKVRGLSVPVVGGASDAAPVLMQCTVSVGWLVSADIASPQTVRSIIECLERAVSEAKGPRNTVVRYTTELRQRRFDAMRADCASCRSKFSVDIPVDKNLVNQPLRCPNCGHEVERPAQGPAAPTIAAPPVQI